MASGKHLHIIIAPVLVVAVGAAAYLCLRPEQAAPVAGVVRATQIRVAPQVGGQLVAIKVQKGDRVRAGDVVAERSAVELTASVGQARAALALAAAARDRVYAGVRAEEVARLAAEVAKAEAHRQLTERELVRKSELARGYVASQQSLDLAKEDAVSARAYVAETEANRAAATAGPTREQLAVADARVGAAAAKVVVLERRLDKTTLRGPPTAL